MGTMRMVPSGRCLRPRGSNGVPVLVQAVPGTRAGGGEDHLPAAAGREEEVIAAQGHGFFRAQRRIVQAAEERRQLRPDPGDLGQDRPDLLRAGHGGRPDGHGGPGRAPAHQVQRVGGQQPELDGITQGAVEHRPLAADRVCRGGRAVHPHAQPVQGSPDDARIAEPADRQRCAFQPGQRAGGARVRRAGPPLLGVEGMPVQGGAHPPGWWPAAGLPGQQRGDCGQGVGQAGPRVRCQVRPFHLRIRHRVPVPGHRRRLCRGPLRAHRWPGRTRCRCGLRGPARRGSCRPAPGS